MQTLSERQSKFVASSTRIYEASQSRVSDQHPFHADPDLDSESEIFVDPEREIFADPGLDFTPKISDFLRQKRKKDL